MKSRCLGAFLISASLLSLHATVKAEGKKDEANGTLTLGDKTYKLQNAAAFETKRGDKKRTAILLSEDPIELDKLKAALKKNGNDDDYRVKGGHVKLIFDENGELYQVIVNAAGVSVNEIGNDNFKAKATIKDGTAKGKAGMGKPDKFFEMEYKFEVEFDLKLTKPD